MPLTDVNMLAVLAAAAVGFAIGAAWYSPFGFGTVWARLSRLSADEMRARAAPAFLAAFVTLLVVAYVLGVFVRLAGAATATAGASVALLVWVGFEAPVTFSDAMFGGKWIRQWALEAAYRLVSTVVMGMILAAWR